MKNLMLAAGFAAAALAMGGDTFACGDKLVIVGRGMRPKRVKGSVPASILVFADPKGSMPAALEEGNLRKDLEKAGHRVRSVGVPRGARQGPRHRQLRPRLHRHQDGAGDRD